MRRQVAPIQQRKTCFDSEKSSSIWLLACSSGAVTPAYPFHNIDIEIAAQSAVRVANHGRTALQAAVGNRAQGNLRT